MKKTIVFAIITLTLLFALTACTLNDGFQQTTPSTNQQTNTSKITKEKAKSIAFEHAGVNSSDVYNFEISFDRDDGIESYEIEFKSANIEYDYDIDAKTGEILKAEKDMDY